MFFFPTGVCSWTLFFVSNIFLHYSTRSAPRLLALLRGLSEDPVSRIMTPSALRHDPWHHPLHPSGPTSTEEVVTICFLCFDRFVKLLTQTHTGSCHHLFASTLRKIFKKETGSTTIQYVQYVSYSIIHTVYYIWYRTVQSNKYKSNVPSISLNYQTSSSSFITEAPL